ncbi:response regulator [Devosia sp. XJ19-1]|uniref:Response regulator n=1 Tax=Devosia ureilytica TaxID=2952754 RepID=A0A9Q4ARX7_9HYPH|nr:response regulator [Devosia ureilytica]MCP8884873.1 response regulator [Devosia ureilytica]MCP8888616.1 response regulator [Devosia ureilytica]
MVSAAQTRALVVDDNAYARAVCTRGLRQFGIGAVDEAADGAEAILKLLVAPYELVLMDWYMPDIGGPGVMQVLRDPRFGASPDIKVVLMTAYPSPENLLRGRRIGFNDVLPKPFTTQHLGAVLTRVLAPQGVPDDVVYV